MGGLKSATTTTDRNCPIESSVDPVSNVAVHFQTKVDPWVGITVAIAALFTLVAPVVFILSSMVSRQPVDWTLLIPVGAWIIVLAATLPQYYELRADGLFIRQGWRRSLVAYDALVSAEAVDSTLSSGVYSTERIRIGTEGAASYLIAPRDGSLFLRELAQRAPRIAQEPQFRLIR